MFKSKAHVKRSGKIGDVVQAIWDVKTKELKSVTIFGETKGVFDACEVDILEPFNQRDSNGVDIYMGHLLLVKMRSYWELFRVGKVDGEIKILDREDNPWGLSMDNEVYIVGDVYEDASIFNFVRYWMSKDSINDSVAEYLLFKGREYTGINTTKNKTLKSISVKPDGETVNTEAETPKVIVEVEDGGISNIYINDINIDVVIVDEDLDGCRQEDFWDLNDLGEFIGNDIMFKADVDRSVLSQSAFKMLLGSTNSVNYLKERNGN